MSCPYRYAMNVSVVRSPAYPQIQFIITLIIISFSSGFDSAIIIVMERLYRMFGTESTDNLYFSVSASQLGNGLDEQLARFVAEHKDTKLIIIDTLQKVREIGGDNYSYANDYQIIARLKSFADAHGLCLLLVHHTRKQNADDKFDMISGTSGLLGAAD